VLGPSAVLAGKPVAACRPPNEKPVAEASGALVEAEPALLPNTTGAESGGFNTDLFTSVFSSLVARRLSLPGFSPFLPPFCDVKLNPVVATSSSSALGTAANFSLFNAGGPVPK
jgi:hypothetical protein